MNALGLVVAAGIPPVVPVLAVVLPVPGERTAERDSYDGDGLDSVGSTSLGGRVFGGVKARYPNEGAG